MFDDLRNSATDQGFPEDIDGDLVPLKASQNPVAKLKINPINFLGLTAFQRFVLSALLFLLILILGFMFLMITSSKMSD